MLLWAMLKVGISSLTANKLRSFLAMLGIIIGVAAVIAMLGIGSGARQQVMDRFAALGSNLLTVMPGQRGSHGVVSGTQQNLSLDDAMAIAEEVENVVMVAPAVRGNAQIKYFNRNARSAVHGTSVTYFPIQSINIERGRAFTENEAESMARVAVIGTVAAENIFEENDPVNEIIKINGINFRIVGLMESKGEGWMSPDDRVIVPYTTAMELLFGEDYLREISIQTVRESDMDQVESDVKSLLRRRHRLQEGEDDDFSVRNMADIRRNVSEVTDVFRWLLGGIAAISLLVGGIGIMNIMLVIVTERTREIGIRKAIGARETHILLQFLIESVIISGLGGVIGLGLGIGVAKAIPNFSQFTTLVEWQSALMALVVATLVGVFFGFYPAWRASTLDPVDALRYE